MKGFESLGFDMIRQGSSPRPSLALTAVPHIGSSSHPPNQKSYFANILNGNQPICLYYKNTGRILNLRIPIGGV